MRVLAFLFAALLLVQAASATYDYQMDHVCEDDDCRQGHGITWIFTYKNHGGKVMSLYEINLKSPDGYLIANYERLFEVGPGETRALNFSSTLPPPDEDNKVVYNICFTRKVDYEDWWALGYEVNRSEFIAKNLEFCYDDNYTLPVKPSNFCQRTSDCSDDMICTNHRCIGLNCSACQYASNHTCFDHECCSPDMCDQTDACVNNTCQPLVCDDSQVILEHECVDMECAPDEFKSGFSCIRLDCEDDEKGIDHRCVPLYCQKNQVAKDHECIDVLCSFFEKVEGDSCRRDHMRIALAVMIALFAFITPFLLLSHRKRKVLYHHQRHCPKCDAVLGPRDTFCYKCRYDLKLGEK